MRGLPRGGTWARAWMCCQDNFLHLSRSLASGKQEAVQQQPGLCLFGLLQVGFCSRQSPAIEVLKRGRRHWKLTVALDFSFSGCSLQLSTDLALNFAESHSKLSASALHPPVPWLLQVRAPGVTRWLLPTDARLLSCGLCSSGGCWRTKCCGPFAAVVVLLY